MYQITKRISDGSSTIIGYVVTDGSQEVQVSKPDVMNWAKQGMIQNVKVSGSTISGTNGFELKSLPTISMKDLQKESNFQLHEKYAAVVRHLDDMGSIPHVEPNDKQAYRDIIIMGNQLLQQEVGSGRITKEMLHANSDNVQVICRFGNTVLPSMLNYLKKFENAPTEVREKVFNLLMSNLSTNSSKEHVLTVVINGVLPIIRDKISENPLPSMVGYLVKTTPNLNSGLKYQKLEYGTGEVLGEDMLYANSTAILTKAEMTQLISRPTMSGEISNYVMRQTSDKNKVAQADNKWDYMSNHILVRKDAEGGHPVYKDIVDLKQILEPEILKRFMPTNLIRDIIAELVVNFFAIEVTERFFRQSGVNEAVIRPLVQATRAQLEAYLSTLQPGEMPKVNLNNAVVGRPTPKKQSKGLFGMFKR